MATEGKYIAGDDEPAPTWPKDDERWKTWRARWPRDDERWELIPNRGTGYGRAGPGSPRGAALGGRQRAFLLDVMESYRALGGIDYLIEMGKSRPRDYAKLLIACVPRHAKIETVSMTLEDLVTASQRIGADGAAPGGAEGDVIDAELEPRGDRHGGD